MFITRAYNRFELDPVYNTITKISKDEKLRDEIFYLTSLPPELLIFFPRVLESGRNNEGYYIKMERYAYKTLGQIMVYDEFNSELWEKILKKISQILEIFLEHKDVANDNSAELMYIDKTEKEYRKLITNHKEFHNLCSHKNIEINGITYINFSGMWDKLKSYITDKIICKKDFSIIHGDMCFSNILCGYDDGNVILKLIDPRGSFGEKGIYGDSLYDQSKLCHSFEGGYEYIIYDAFTIKFDSKMQSFNYQLFNDNIKKIGTLRLSPYCKLVEGLIYIGMCARHYDSINRQLAMYITGIKLLNEFMEEAAV